jgi:hypothetical protein
MNVNLTAAIRQNWCVTENNMQAVIKRVFPLKWPLLLTGMK